MKPTKEELHAAAMKMRWMGGGFAGRLADAYMYADSGNQQRIIEAFGHLFEKYLPTKGETE